MMELIETRGGGIVPAPTAPDVREPTARVWPREVLPAAADLVDRADAELVAAQFAHESWERFVYAHLAALRAAAAVIAVHGRPRGRHAPRTVWEMLRVVEPDLGPWAGLFASGAGTRTAIEAGRFDAVTEESAERLLCAAEDFVDEVRRRVAGPSAAASGALALRAS
jgi:hypothetical protein